VITGPTLKHVFKREPVFVLTADLDWASEFCVETLLAATRSFPSKPTLFVTHHSAAATAAKQAGAVDLAPHPNFLPGSTHGDNPDAVVAHTRLLAPGTPISRAHCFASSTHINRALLKAGFKHDSGPLLMWQQDLTPLRNGLGLTHYPVFWEDDVHWDIEPDWDLARVEDRFFQPGLKILNVHPFFFALNIPNADFYRLHKPLIQTIDAAQVEQFRFPGEGCATFTQSLVETIRSSGARCCTLDELCEGEMS
jgi:hypothetical protein